MARLYLVRHAPTPETGTKLTGRLPGVSLGDKGEAVARQAAQRLAGVKIRRVFTSPIERTRETAAIIAAAHGLEPEVEPGMTEVDFGDWQGRSLAQLRRTKLWREVVTTPSRVRFPNGESFPEMQVRATDACNRIAASVGPTGSAIVVSHSDVIKAVLSHYLGQPLDLFQRIGIAPASVSVVDLPAQGSPFVSAVNSFATFD